jgi:hypothetical protein
MYLTVDTDFGDFVTSFGGRGGGVMLSLILVNTGQLKSFQLLPLCSICAQISEMHLKSCNPFRNLGCGMVGLAQ